MGKGFGLDARLEAWHGEGLEAGLKAGLVAELKAKLEHG